MLVLLEQRLQILKLFLFVLQLTLIIIQQLQIELEDLDSLVNTTINDYNNNNLKQFNSNFRYSELLTLIDNTVNL